MSSVTDIDLTGTRLLLVTPHPDDESLAVGGLIRQAVQQDATVTLVQVTDGDNNPWPQRWLERRWRIGPVERQRWGRRRVSEVQQAIRHLGLSPAALQRLGWPDMGVDKHLHEHGMRAVDAVADVVRRAAPDIVVVPDLGDRHPDHGASHVLLRLALARLPSQPTCLTYLVHGHGSLADTSCTLVLDAEAQAAKRRAVMAHHTQVALARRRLLAMVGPQEQLYRLSPREYSLPEAMPDTMPLPWNPSRALHPWLQLTVAHPDGIHAWRWREAPLRHDGHAWQLRLPASIRRIPVFAKLELRSTSPWIFDHWGWSDLTAATSARQADR